MNPIRPLAIKQDDGTYMLTGVVVPGDEVTRSPDGTLEWRGQTVEEPKPFESVPVSCSTASGESQTDEATGCSFSTGSGAGFSPSTDHIVNKIEFPLDEQNNSDRDAVQFSAKVDGQRIRCFITYEALVQRFGARKGVELQAFKSNRMAIEIIATEMIKRGRHENGELLIKSADFPGPSA